MNKYKRSSGWGKDKYCQALVMGGQVILERTHFGPDGASLEEKQANLDLACAAPELLEVIYEMLEWNDELQDKVQRVLSGMDKRDIETLAHKIARVLAKAEGKKS